MAESREHYMEWDDKCLLAEILRQLMLINEYNFGLAKFKFVGESHTLGKYMDAIEEQSCRNKTC